MANVRVESLECFTQSRFWDLIAEESSFCFTKSVQSLESQSSNKFDIVFLLTSRTDKTVLMILAEKQRPQRFLATERQGGDITRKPFNLFNLISLKSLCALCSSAKNLETSKMAWIEVYDCWKFTYKRQILIDITSE